MIEKVFINQIDYSQKCIQNKNTSTSWMPFDGIMNADFD